MYVRRYVCMYVGMYVCTYVHMYVCMYACSCIICSRFSFLHAKNGQAIL